MNRKKVMLIMDNEDVSRRVLREIFCSDYEILEASDQAQALVTLHRLGHRISVVLLSNGMPEEHGFFVLDEMMYDPVLQNIPVIMTIQRGDDETGILKRGARDVIEKPFKTEVARARVYNVIGFDVEDKGLLEKMEWEAAFDSLTGIFNKASFYRSTQRVLRRHEDKDFAIIRIDIERFKVVNELFGNEEGDRVLRHIGKGLETLFELRSSCTYGRIDGDIFSVCAPGNEETVPGIIEEIEKMIASYPIQFELIPCFGVYFVKNHRMSVNLMCDRANLALRTVKGNYVKRFAYYDDSLRRKMLQEQSIISQMNMALEEEQFVIYLQPKYNLNTGTIIGSEALVRWQHPTRGLISPAEFIPIFERNGFIMRLDYYVWEKTCQLLRRWTQEGKVLTPISVNVSRINLFNPFFCEQITQLVKKYGISPAYFQLEITESAYTDNPKVLLDVMQKLQGQGFTILMDDFGSGYSSLNLLKDLPVDILKIDLRFLAGESARGRGGNILSSVIRMAKWLGIPTIVEGIETTEQNDFLRSVGCSLGQGYLFARPMPVECFETFASTHQVSIKEEESVLESWVNIDELWDPNAATSQMFYSMVSAVGIYELDGDRLEPIRLNESYFQMIRSTREAFYRSNLNVMRWVDQKDKETVLYALKQAKDTKTVSMVKYRRYLEDGSVLWLQTRIQYLAGSGQRHLYYIWMDDISDDVKNQNDHLTLLEKNQLLAEYTKVSNLDYDMETDILHYTVYENNRCYSGTLQGKDGGLDPAPAIDPRDDENLRRVFHNLEGKNVQGTYCFRGNFDGTGYCRYAVYYVSLYKEQENTTRVVGRILKVSRFGITDGENAVETMEALITSNPGGICRIKMVEGSPLLYANEQYYKTRKITPEEMLSKRQNNAGSFWHPDCAGHIADLVDKAIEEKQSTLLFNGKILSADGETRNLICGCGITYFGDAPIINCTEYDITEMRDSELQAHINQSMFKLAFEKSNMALWEYDVKDQLFHLSEMFCKMFLISTDTKELTLEDIKKHWNNTQHLETFLEYHERVLGGESVSTEMFVHRNGKELWTYLSYFPVCDDEGNVLKAVGFYEDADERIRRNKDLERQARMDPLTASYNHGAIEAEINAAILTIDKGAFFMLDVDDFKKINDRCGHLCGDEVLKMAIQTLRGMFGEKALIGRLGGDEFCIFLPYEMENDLLAHTAKTICEKIAAISVEGYEAKPNVSCSLGVAKMPRHGMSFQELYCHADAAQYVAKRSGKNKFCIWDDHMEDSIGNVKGAQL